MSEEGLVRVDREDIATEYDLLPGYGPCPIGGGPEEGVHPKKTSRRFFIPDQHRHGEQIVDIKLCVVVSWFPSSRSPFVSFLSPPLFFPFYSRVELTFDLHLPSILPPRVSLSCSLRSVLNVDVACRSPLRQSPLPESPLRGNTVHLLVHAPPLTTTVFHSPFFQIVKMVRLSTALSLVALYLSAAIAIPLPEDSALGNEVGVSAPNGIVMSDTDEL